MNDWLNARWDWLVSFLLGVCVAMFAGGRAYQNLKSTQTEHDGRITALETAMKESLDRQSRETGRLFDRIEMVRGEMHQIGVQQSSLAASVEQYGRRMDSLVQRYDRANERAETLAQQQIELLRQYGWRPKGEGST